MDKKLLLAVQYVCNLKGVGVPWDDIGHEMGDKITGGAVIQHLAKLRTRMIEQGLSVPPPLRRGGGASRISTTSYSLSKVKTASNNKVTKAKPKVAKSKSATKKTKKSGSKGSDSSDESDDDDWDDEGSDADYGEPKAKRPKNEPRGPMRRVVKTEDSDEEVNMATETTLKRRQKGPNSPGHELSAYGHTDINGVPINYDDDSDEDEKANVVGAGASWLALEDDRTSHRKTGTKTPYKKKSLIVSLPNNFKNNGMAGDMGDEDYADMSDDESEEEVAEEASAGADDNVVDGSQLLSNEEIEEAFSTAPIHRDLNDLSNGQLRRVSGHASYAGNNNNSYYTEPPSNSFNGGYDSFSNSFGNGLNNHSSSQFDGGHFDDNIFNDTPVMNQPSAFAGAPGLNYNVGFNTHDFGNQATSSFGSFSNNGGVNGLPYPIQTSLSSNQGLADAYSSNTSVNQTPAGPSAGADSGNGYFNNDSQFDLGSFNDSNFAFSPNDDTLVNAGGYDGNFGGGVFGSGFYGN